MFRQVNNYIALACVLVAYAAGALYLVFFDCLKFHIPCVFRLITGIPCPGCGMTRAFIHILNGNFLLAFNTNIFAPLLFVFLAILPLWILIDILRGNNSLYQQLHRHWSRNATIILFVVLAIGWLHNILAAV